MKHWQFLLFGIFIGLLAAGLILLIALPPRGKPLTILPAPTPTSTTLPIPTRTQTPILVQINGEIANPGIHFLPEGSRLSDLISIAGGLTPQADQKRINFVHILADGDYYYIPAIDEEIPETARNAPGNVSIPGGNKFSYPLDLNSATQDALESLPGVGPSKAADIIAYRESVGLFSTVDELLNVPGIGPATLEAISEFLMVED